MQPDAEEGKRGRGIRSAADDDDYDYMCDPLTGSHKRPVPLRLTLPRAVRLVCFVSSLLSYIGKTDKKYAYIQYAFSSF